jgi:hypothetical protein
MQYVDTVTKLNEFLESDIVTASFGEISTEEVLDTNAPVISIENVDLPKDGVGHRSGVYMIYTTKGEVYYIGKATKNNLHEEVWGKVKTPSKNENGTSFYPKNYFLSKKHLDQSAVNDVMNGNVKIGAVVIENPLLASLAEVYLQTLYSHINSGKLPKLNSRIG